MQLGNLEIQLMADIARLRKDMDDAKSAVGGAMADITKAVDFAKGALVAFTGIASINAFKGMIEGSLQSVAALRELSIQTGASVESMSALVAVGKLTGTSGDDIASMMNKLAKNMSVANEESKGTAQAIKALGLDFNEFNALSPDEKLMAMAEAMNEFQDGSDKSAAAMTLLGKSGAAALPYLKELAEIGTLQAKVTEEQAAQARQFEVDQKRLTASGQAWKKELALGMLPAIQETMSAVLGLVNGTGGLRAEVKKLSEDGSIVEWTRGAVTAVTYLMDAFSYVKDLAQSIGVVVGYTIDYLVNAFGTLASVIVKVIKGDYRGAIDDVTTSNDRAKLQFSALKDTLSDTWGGDTLGKQLRDRIKDIQDVGVAGEGIKEKLNFKAAADTGKSGSEASAYDTISASISKELAMATQLLEMGRALTESERFQITTREALDKAMQQGKITAQQDLELKTKLTEAVNKAAEAERFLAAQKAIATNNAAADKALDATQKEIDALIASNEQLRLNNEIIGLSTQEVDKLTLARVDSAIALKELNLLGVQGIDGQEMQVAMLEREINLLKQKRDLTATGQSRAALAKEAAASFEEWKKGWEATDALARDVFTSWATEGGNAAQKIGDSLKKALLSAIYEATLKPIAFQLYSSVTGALGMPGATSAGASALGAAGNAAGIGNFLNSSGAMGGLFSSNAAYGAAIGTTNIAAGSQAAMLAAQTGEFGLAGVTATSSAAAGAGAGASSILSAIPGWGWALAGIAVLGSLAGGGFKSSSTTGESAIGVDSLGKVTANTGTRYGASAGSDAAVTSMKDSYLAAAKALGITAARTEFFYGGNTGAQGENPNFALSGGVVGKGGYSIGETAVSDDAVKLAMARALLGTLQQSDLPKYLAGVFDTLAVGSMSQQEITAALATAQSFKALHDQLLSLPFDQLKDMSYKAASGLLAASGGLDKFQANLATYYDKFYSATEKTATATASVAKVFADLGLTMPKLDANARSTFRALEESFSPATAAGQKAIAALLGVSGAFDQLVTAADAAAQAQAKAIADIQKLVSGVHDSVNSSIFNMQYGQEDNAGKYRMLDVKGANLDKQLHGTDDINQIAKIAADQIAVLNQAFGLLDANQQKGATVAFEEKLTAIDDYVTAKGADAQSVLAAQNQAQADTIAAAVKIAVAEAMANSAAELAAAAASIEAASKNPVVSTIQIIATKSPGIEVAVEDYSGGGRG